jgi:hypothetical protein
MSETTKQCRGREKMSQQKYRRNGDNESSAWIDRGNATKDGQRGESGEQGVEDEMAVSAITANDTTETKTSAKRRDATKRALDIAVVGTDESETTRRMRQQRNEGNRSE